MKYFIIRDGENIKHVEPIGHDFTAEDVLVVDKEDMPVYVHQEGKTATLKYSEAEGVHYEYTDMPVNMGEISDAEAIAIITGGVDA